MSVNKNKVGSNAWRFRGNELKYVKEVLDAGFASGTTGTMNKRLEESFAKRFGVKYAVTSNSGTSTLHQALFALDVGPGDEVILSPLAPVMCAYAIFHAGATPVFADVSADTFLIDPVDIERKVTKKTKVIMAVHLYGQVCDMVSIMKIAKKYRLKVLEDCAQCYLGTDSRGRLGGTIGDIGSFSLQSSKHLTCGDGGILVTDSEILSEKMRKFGGLGFKHIRGDRNKVKKNRDLFQDPTYLRHELVGYNYRLSEIGAAVALAQVEKIDWLVEKRKKMSDYYTEAIRETGVNWLIPQSVPEKSINSRYIFAASLETKGKKFDWYDFREKYIEFGGDGIYSAWALAYQEPAVVKQLATNGMKFHRCPVAEELQKKILQFTTNQRDDREMQKQASVLEKTIKFFSQ